MGITRRHLVPSIPTQVQSISHSNAWRVFKRRSSMCGFAVSVANVTVTQQFFSAVTQESSEFTEDQIDGILGLAFQDISSLGQVGS